MAAGVQLRRGLPLLSPKARTCCYHSVTSLRAWCYHSLTSLRACCYHFRTSFRACCYHSLTSLRACCHHSLTSFRTCCYHSLTSLCLLLSFSCLSSCPTHGRYFRESTAHSKLSTHAGRHKAFSLLLPKGLAGSCRTQVHDVSRRGAPRFSPVYSGGHTKTIIRLPVCSDWQFPTDLLT